MVANNERSLNYDLAGDTPQLKEINFLKQRVLDLTEKIASVMQHYNSLLEEHKIVINESKQLKNQLQNLPRAKQYKEKIRKLELKLAEKNKIILDLKDSLDSLWNSENI